MVDHLKNSIEKKFDNVFVDSENSINLKDERLIPIIIHNENQSLDDLSNFISKRYGVLISKNDANENLELFIQIKNSNHQSKILKYINQISYIFINVFAIAICLFKLNGKVQTMR